MACSRAAGVQHCPTAVASGVSQQLFVLTGASVAGVNAPPQQPLVAGGLKASAGSPTKPPGWVSVLM
jgi:hypothetical protein